MSTSMPNRFGVLRYRDFRLLLIDRFLAPSAFAFSVVGVSFAVLKATGSTADLSYVLAAQIAPNLVFAPLGGVIADRVPPQYVIACANLLVALSEGSLGLLVLTHHAVLWQMILLEAGTGTAVAIFYPASQALLPKLVPDAELQQANAVSRLVMNGAMMGGAAAGGFLVAAVGPGWALVADAIGMSFAVLPNLFIRAAATAREQTPGIFTELREGWDEFRSHTWLWGIVVQYSIVLMCWYGSFSVLGPAVAARHLGGPAAWGAIMAFESIGLIVGGLVALRFTPRRPMLFVALIGATIALPSLALAMLWPVWLICLTSLGVGVAIEAMMVQWNVVMARYIPAEKLARVSAYDVLGSVMSMPIGALLAGPIATAIGVSRTQYAAAVLIVATSALTLLSRDIRTRRSTDTPSTVLRIREAGSEAGTVSAATQSGLSAAAISSDA
ncbi:MFS transporter [Actinocrinis puniceicyclus]|uniref:MFS transporter n=1 Tax=Actinocrinis puniceicyclus TaxID=977794 RepID=A0A8J7WLN3_9ACTN|nr:MFS transporter [Actinocrinis puniceicyclus]MBS2961770.1 MFS transporter [Actinocrinis puniceicyclus]